MEGGCRLARLSVKRVAAGQYSFHIAQTFFSHPSSLQPTIADTLTALHCTALLSPTCQVDRTRLGFSYETIATNELHSHSRREGKGHEKAVCISLSRGGKGEVIVRSMLQVHSVAQERWPERANTPPSLNGTRHALTTLPLTLSLPLSPFPSRTKHAGAAGTSIPESFIMPSIRPNREGEGKKGAF